MTGLTIRSYVFLAVNIGLQLFLVCMIGEAAHVMNPYSGQMHLCDFGANIPQCPDAPNCRGPGGTSMTYPRLYGYSIWSTRSFVRESLKLIFPESAEQVDALIDPGEWGLENYFCRLVCCFLFMLSVVDNFRGSFDIMSLLWNLPSRPDTWIKYDPPTWEEKDTAKAVHGWNELDLVKFQVAGMPFHWKIINFCIVLCPKLLLWVTLVNAGFHFLMETAGFVDLVVNSMALAFILDIDEMVFERLGTVASRHIMEHMEDLPLFEEDFQEDETEDEVLDRFCAEEFGKAKPAQMVKVIMPWFLIVVVLVMAGYLSKYYFLNCVRQPDGSMTSKPMYLPTGVSYLSPSFLFSFLMQEEEEPFWTMPEYEA